jgi:hypothetical protein
LVFVVEKDAARRGTEDNYDFFALGLSVGEPFGLKGCDGGCNGGRYGFDELILCPKRTPIATIPTIRYPSSIPIRNFPMVDFFADVTINRTDIGVFIHSKKKDGGGRR